MSVHSAADVQSTKKAIQTVASLMRKKSKGQKIVSLTCYDYSTARILDGADVDMLLVGDSLGMTVLGYPNTLQVTMTDMLHHAAAVARGTRHALVVADMPFMSYQNGLGEAVRNAGRFIQEANVQAVKVEGATPRVIALVQHLVEIGIPVVGHLGFTPQSVNTMGGFKVQGKSIDAAKMLLAGALALETAGAFAVVLEMVPLEVAELVTRRLSIPTIGIGAGNVCDGQILVIDDLLGRYSELSPRFVRRYLDSTTLVREAVNTYAADIQSGDFPNAASEAFAFPVEALPELMTLLERAE